MSQATMLKQPIPLNCCETRCLHYGKCVLARSKRGEAAKVTPEVKLDLTCQQEGIFQGGHVHLTCLTYSPPDRVSP